MAAGGLVAICMSGTSLALIAADGGRPAVVGAKGSVGWAAAILVGGIVGAAAVTGDCGSSIAGGWGVVAGVGCGAGDGVLLDGWRPGDSGGCSESSSMMRPCAWLWWYLRPFACLYFLLQSCSGHSSSTGEMGHGTVVFTFFAGI